MEGVDPMFEQRVNNALVATTMNMYVHGQVRHVTTIAPNFYFLQMDLYAGEHGGYRVNALCMDDQHECRLFLDGPAFMTLILHPMTRAVQDAIKDYHSIGHGF